MQESKAKGIQYNINFKNNVFQVKWQDLDMRKNFELMPFWSANMDEVEYRLRAELANKTE